MENKGTVWLETDRLILRRFTMEDTDGMYRNYASDPLVTTYLTWPTHTGPDVTRELLSQWTARYVYRDFYQWAIELRDTREVIGSISVVGCQQEVSSMELGWCIGSRWWGCSLVPEAAAAVIRYLFECVGVLRVTARCDVENPRSARVMEKVGMSREGTLRASGRNNRGIVDMLCYGILRSEYDPAPEPFSRAYEIE